MCNACGFACCASDCFSGCGCDHCENPECWLTCPDCGDTNCEGALDGICRSDDIDYSDDEDEAPVSRCIGCGCTDLRACTSAALPGPCHWLRVNEQLQLGVCSACQKHLQRWDSSDNGKTLPEALGRI